MLVSPTQHYSWMHCLSGPTSPGGRGRRPWRRPPPRGGRRGGPPHCKLDVNNVNNLASLVIANQPHGTAAQNRPEAAASSTLSKAAVTSLRQQRAGCATRCSGAWYPLAAALSDPTPTPHAIPPTVDTSVVNFRLLALFVGTKRTKQGPDQPGAAKGSVAGLLAKMLRGSARKAPKVQHPLRTARRTPSTHPESHRKAFPSWQRGRPAGRRSRRTSSATCASLTDTRRPPCPPL